MKTHRRHAVVGLTLVTALALTGCTHDGTTTTAAAGSTTATTSTAPPDAATELATAQSKLLTQSSKVTMELPGSIKATGAMDPLARASSMDLTMGSTGQTITMTMRRVGTDVYLKMGGALASISQGKWMHIDISKVGNGALAQAGDPKFAADMLKSSTAVKRTGPHSFSGTIDLTKANAALGTDGVVSPSLAANAKAVPFTATTDTEGRLVTMSVDMSSLGEGTGVMKTTYSDFGTPVSVTAPPMSEVAEMPASMRGMFSGK